MAECSGTIGLLVKVLALIMKYRVLTYNIHKGFDTLGTKFTLHQIKEALRETGADLCLLQEVVGEDHAQKKNQKDWPLEAQFEFLADSI